MNKQLEVQVFTKFLDLIKEYFRKERNITFYAGKLGLEPDELSRIIREKSDSSFSDWIRILD
ncbi:MAG: hypothetical protein LBQ60_06865 [Bacteroidales bacterium]|jgi:YesN/AraC family two-component response regulator|nr:hypothetical protein [Bacteroidales bacterium]